MDIFKQQRYLLIVIVLLVIMNIGTLLMLWIGKPSHPSRQRGPIPPKHEKSRIEQLLKVELGFNVSQIRKYLKMRQEHRRTTQQLNDEIRQVKKAMFDEVLQDNAKEELSDSLLTLAQEKQAKLEQLTFQHFLDLKKLCKPEQQEHLKFLMNQLFRQNSPPGMKNDGHPPPPGN